MAAAEPPTKKAKLDEEPVVDEEDPALTQPPREFEEDAPTDSRPKLKEPIVFRPEDTTINLIPASSGNLLMPLTDGGLQYLLAGARANVGITAGRYLFEAKMVELVNTVEDTSARQKTPQPRCQLRVGLSCAGSSLLLTDSSQCCYFDTEGNFVQGGKTVQVAEKYGQHDVVGVLLNLDNSSPNKNSVSLFVNGVRACQPQDLVADLVGKTLFPTLTFKNTTVHFNFGPVPMAPLPFKCKMFQDSAVKDASVTPPVTPAKGGKFEVIFPVALPDEGGFDWLDGFLEQNKSYTEISDRAILTWLEQSGMVRQKGRPITSHDKPEFGFGIDAVEDQSIRKALLAVAPLQARNYVVMELKSNLVKEERKEAILRWPASRFRRCTAVMLGEPPAAFKKKSQEGTLKNKQEMSDAEFRAKVAAEKAKKAAEKLAKQREKERKKALKLQRKKQEELRKKIEEEQRRKAEALKMIAGMTEGAAAEEERKEEEPEAPAEEKESESEPEEVVMEEEKEEEPPKVELTPEEKKLWFRKDTVTDLSTYVYNMFFTKFSQPEKDEGWDEIRYEWQKGDKVKDYLKSWVQERKLSTRVEDLQPSEWFQTKYKEFQKLLQTCHTKQTQFKASIQQKAAAKAQKIAAIKAKKERAEAERIAKEKARAMAKAAKAEAFAKAVEEAKAAGKEPPEEEPDKEDEPEPPASIVEEEEEKEEDDDGRVNWGKLDVFGVDDFMDAGGGEPLFQQFAFEDWTMLNFRFEMHLLASAFKRDVKDPDRIGIHVDHLPFYYSKYYKKTLNIKYFGVETVTELLDIVRDAVVVNRKSKVMEPQLPDDLESCGVFFMLTEEARRDRQRRIDLGDEGARLKFATPQASGGGGYGGGGYGGGNAGAQVQRPPMNAHVPPVRPQAWGVMPVQQGMQRPPFQQGMPRPFQAMGRPMQPQQGQWRGW